MNILNCFKKDEQPEILEQPEQQKVKTYVERLEELKLQNIDQHNKIEQLIKLSEKFSVGMYVKTIYDNSPVLIIRNIVPPSSFIWNNRFDWQYGYVICKYFNNNKDLVEVKLNFDELVAL